MDDFQTTTDAANWLFSQSCTFVAGSSKLDSLPGMTLPEVAFVGRSNVGKSSLVNALTSRRDLARTSKTPGRTQQLNFFNLGDKIMLVDLPGYGFASVSKSVSSNWHALAKTYLKGRANLARVYVLIDSRHGIKKLDEEMFDLFDQAAVSYQIILTKSDKISPLEATKVIDETVKKLSKHVAAHPEVLLTSSNSKDGIEELRQRIVFVTNPNIG